MSEVYYSIRDLEKLTGIRMHTIRMWEKRYGLLKPGRTEGNFRNYDNTDLKHLLNLSILTRAGYRISHLANLESSQLNQLILNQYRKEYISNSQIEKLILSMAELNEARFEKHFSEMIREFGFEKTFEEVVIPFFKRVGVMWQTGSINPAQEHFLTNLIRQKLLVAINELPSAYPAGSKLFLLFLPEWELHELGLLYYSYLIRKSGSRVIYLGQSNCVHHLRQITDVIHPDVILTSLSASADATKVHGILRKLADIFPGKQILVTGFQVCRNDLQLPSIPELTVFTGPEEFRSILGATRE